MSIAAALARCPTLRLIVPDPVGVADTWATLLVRLESIGAQVDSEAPGVAAFDVALGRHARPLLCGWGQEPKHGAIAPRGPRVGVMCGVLDIPQQRAIIERQRHERVSQLMG